MKTPLLSSHDLPRLLLGAALGAIGAIAVVSPLSLFPRAWVEAPTSIPAPDTPLSTEPAHASWPPHQWTDDPKWQWIGFDNKGWSAGYVGAYRNLEELLDPLPAGAQRLVLPLFPTVYQPDNIDRLYYNWIAEGPIQEGDKVLVIGTGSGADSWAVSLKTRSKVYAVDINPLAVLNARVTAKLGGFDLEIVAGDFQEIELPETFRDFDYVLWNMPFVEVGANDENFQSRNFHDGDDGTIATRFLERLPSLLKPDGTAIALNYALARNFLKTPGTTTHVDPKDEASITDTTYMLFVIPNPGTAQ